MEQFTCECECELDVQCDERTCKRDECEADECVSTCENKLDDEKDAVIMIILYMMNLVAR